ATSPTRSGTWPPRSTRPSWPGPSPPRAAGTPSSTPPAPCWRSGRRSRSTTSNSARVTSESHRRRAPAASSWPPAWAPPDSSTTSAWRSAPASSPPPRPPSPPSRPRWPQTCREKSDAAHHAPVKDPPGHRHAGRPALRGLVHDRCRPHGRGRPARGPADRHRRHRQRLPADHLRHHRRARVGRHQHQRRRRPPGAPGRPGDHHRLRRHGGRRGARPPAARGVRGLRQPGPGPGHRPRGRAGGLGTQEPAGPRARHGLGRGSAMLLTVDVGNTHIRLGVFPPDGGPLERTWSMRTSPSVTSDELALTIRGLLGECAGRLTGISAMSVVPSVTGELRRMPAADWPGLPSVAVPPGVKPGVPLLVDNPREVGSDRVVNALAVHTLFDGAVVVVDVDTATTVDAISGRGELLGGAIAPGIDISVGALAERAAAPRKAQVVPPGGAVGKDTVAGREAGIVIGFAGQIDALVNRLRDEVDGLADASVVLTGMRADVVAEESRTVTDVEHELALEGLRLVFERNT